ncbi:MAG TPA: CHAT domain-containing protein, partial [Thermoanaerobaculia bacterium]|nr:CHAT domain-containing protein [Thermoanaerobaculia bacterium]
LLHLARLEDDSQAAEDLSLRALRLAEEAGNRETQAQALDGLARVRRREGDLHGALAAAEDALGRIESLREEPAGPDTRASFLATKQRTYGLAIDLFRELGEDRKAFEASERARARSLLDILAGRSARPVFLDEVQRELLDGDSVLLQYALGEERSVLWAVTPGTFETFELPPRKVLEDAARSAHVLLAASHQTLARARTAQALDELSRLLLSPVAGRLGNRRLVVVGDGALLALPFGALPAAAGHEVVTLPSISALAALRRKTAGRPPAPDTLAVVADPIFGDRLPPLPFSREEARTLLALVPEEERLAILGTAATREAVTSGRLARYRIVHFATHGILDAEQPERSGIALSDGFLRAKEIDRLDLPADLVVLSACETALGREIRGEGLVGLPRAFLHAGARRVLVSLWPVEDRATAELMRRFYREMLDRGRPPAAALRAAQVSLAREPGWGAPYYWAGFVLQGDWR